MEKTHSSLALEAGPLPQINSGLGLSGSAASTSSLDIDVATCRVCGCTEEQACQGGCWWVEDPEGLGDLCSSCLPGLETDDYLDSLTTEQLLERRA